MQQDILQQFAYNTVRRRDTNIALDEVRTFYVIASGRVKLSVYHPVSGREHTIFLLGRH